QLKAVSVMLRDAQKRAIADNIQVTYFGLDEKPLATLVSSGATMNTQNQNLQFHGPVNVTSVRGETFYARALRYDGVRKKVYGSGGIRATRGTSILTGDTMEGDPRSKVVDVRGHVQVMLHSLATTPAAHP